ncbi:MAG: phage protein Gp36 family protein [Flavobacteriales bacterium]
MSTFITEADYERAITASLLARVHGGNTALLDDCENQAIEFMRGYLAARYDVAAIFGATDTSRNPIVLKYAIDIALWYLYNRLPANEVPENRLLNYQAADKWLGRVQKEEINPPDLPKITDGTKDYVLSGGNPKRTNHIT